MTAEFKIVHDPVHGSIKVSDIALPLLNSLEVSRLREIKQLGLAHLVFPGANHTRLEHSLGTSYIATEISNALGLDEEEQRMLTAAALLHDIGHGPFSHVIEGVVTETTGKDHMDITMDIIRGDYDPINGEIRGSIHGKRVVDILEDYDLEPEEVAELIRETEPERIGVDGTLPVQEGQSFFKDEKSYLKQIIHGTVDADQIDFLLRDSYYTGVAHGVIDIDRIMKTLVLHHNDVVIDIRGIAAIEGLLVARMLMYTSVYFHKTTRIAEQMLSRGLERCGPIDGIERMTDAKLVDAMQSSKGFGREIINRILYRRLYKAAYLMYPKDLTEKNKDTVLQMVDTRKRRETEDEIAGRLGLEEGEVIIDVPSKALLTSEPRIKKTAFKILDKEGKIGTLANYSPVAKALQRRRIPEWILLMAAPPEKVAKVRKKGPGHLFP